MNKSTSKASGKRETTRPNGPSGTSRRNLRKARKGPKKSDVLISAVISTYLLTHLHQVLQRAEYGAVREGRNYQAENFAKLRKLLCMDARSMEDASASGVDGEDFEQFSDTQIESNVA